MTESSLNNISAKKGPVTADSLTGMIFAAEGIRNTLTVLNGPMGCRFYHSSTSQFRSIRPKLYLPTGPDDRRVPVDYNYLNDWFFRQERVPCTYLDGYDYVYGSEDKLTEALAFFRKYIDFDLLVLANSPGASLIGDNLKEIAVRELPARHTVMLESPGYSGRFEDGYREAIDQIIRQLIIPEWSSGQRTEDRTQKTGPSVNILGLSIWQRYWEGDCKELVRLFESCGIRVNCMPCADSPLSDLLRIPEASLNLVLYPEMGLESAKLLEREFGTPYYVCENLPIGFDAVEKCFTDICSLLGRDCGPLLEESHRARAIAWYHIDNTYQACGLPKGTPFYVSGNPSQVRSYSAFLKDYLGMEQTGPDQAELLFGDANLIAMQMLKNRTLCGIEINLPGMGYTDIIPKTHMGIQGTLFLIEQVLNGLMSRI